jgi:lipopolysaccharide transport system permease protein
VFLVVALSHHKIGMPLVVLPILIVIQFLLTLSVLLITATFNVFYRDLQQLIPIAMLLLFYLIPIFYPLSSVPAALRPFILANPFVAIALAYQNVFYANAWPDFNLLLYTTLTALALFAIGIAVFTRYEETFTEYL